MLYYGPVWLMLFLCLTALYCSLWNQFLGKLFVFSSIFTFLCCCKVFCGEPIQQPVPSASHHSTSIRPRVREYQRGKALTLVDSFLCSY